ncbi:disulfide bond formation protein DsbA [Pseudonocardia sp. CNS-139]|nr:disulfide bond formation protein DsbA [Pseudonocardia sp. CNS-139]
MADPRPGGPRRLDVWFDPACPFSWVTAQWAAEAGRVRDVAVGFHVMSLSVLNEHRDDLSPGYRAHLDRQWAPVRVAVAAAQQAGPEVLRPLCFAMARRIHHEQNADYGVVVKEALSETGLPAGLAAAADSTEFDETVRVSHRAGVAGAGEPIGSPVVHVDGAGFFGPVLTRVPRGEDAGRLLDAVAALAAAPHFFELKRSRTERPVFG